MAVFTLKQINDLKIRMLVIPIFGIIIPNLTGLFGNLMPDDVMYWLGYLFFIGISWIIYHGNRFLLLKAREHYDWFQHPFRKLMLLLFANVFYTAPVTVLLVLAWFNLAAFDAIDWHVVETVTLMNVIAVIFVTHAYETVFLIKERESDSLQVEKMQRAKAESELEAIKSQIDPHFMFNSLNTLSHLIRSDADKAYEFTEHLSDVYRYILMNKNRQLVSLAEEIELLMDYYKLLKLRFAGGLLLKIDELDGHADAFLPPISLQILLENVVKHNELDEEKPLLVTLEMNDDYVLFTNDIRKRNVTQTSGLGLKGLMDRYKIITEKEIEIRSTNSRYVVKLPLIRMSV